jgi:hypothetical protein
MFKKLFLNEQNKASFMKLGAWIVSIIAVLLSENIIPASGIPIAKAVVAIGGLLFATGARDAIGKK